MLDACCAHHVRIETHFVSVVIAIGVLEGIGRTLDPDLDILAAAVPFLLRAKLGV